MITMLRDTAAGFSTFAEFLNFTAGTDRQFLSEDEAEKFSPTVCGMANGSGGWILFGAGTEDDVAQPVAYGLRDSSELKEKLEYDISRKGAFSTRVDASFHRLENPVPLLAVRVYPASWHERPVSIGGDYKLGVFRRYEGENFMSGKRAKFLMGLDALERLRSDDPVIGVKPEDLDQESVEAFRDAVTELRPEWGPLSLKDFLSRAMVLSGDAVTMAGNWLLGKNPGGNGAIVSIGMETKVKMRNIWSAYSLLPGLTRSFSEPCAAAFRECFINALLHADYSAGGVRVTLSPSGDIPAGNPLTALFENSGLPRSWRDGSSECRNFRLMKIFQLLGAAKGEGCGMAVIRKYMPDFGLAPDNLELTTRASLELEGKI